MTQGTVAKTFQNSFGNKTLHAFALQGQDGIYYRTGEYKVVDEGDVIEFEEKQVGSNFYANNISKTGKVDVAQTSQGKGNFGKAAARSGGGGREAYWEEKEKRDIVNGRAMRWQGAYDRALKMVDMLISHEAVKPPSEVKTLSKRAEYVESMVLEYAQSIYDKTGEVSEGAGSTEAYNNESPMEVGTQEEGDSWNA